MVTRRLGQSPSIEMLECRRLLYAAVAAGLLDIPSTMPLKQSEYSQPVAVVGTKVIFGDAGNGSDSSPNPSADPANTYDFADIYDVSTGLWTTNQRPHILGDSVVTVGQKAIFAGGDSTTQTSGTAGRTDVDIYDNVTGQWTTAQLSAPRLTIATTTVGDKAIFAGGESFISAGGEGGPQSAVDLYDASTGQWSSARLSVARWNASAVSAGGKAIIAGGETHPYYPFMVTDAVDIYDDQTGQWSIAHLSSARFAMSAVGVGDKAIFAGGSVTDTTNFFGSATTAAIDIYDATTGNWSTAQLSQRRDSPGTTTVGNLAFFAGGSYRDHNNASHASSVLDIYNNANGRWTASQLPVPLGPGEAFTIGARAVFIGWNGLRTQTGIIEIYDTDTGRWSLAELPSNLGHIIPVDGKLLVTQRQEYQPTPPFPADLLAFTDTVPAASQFPADSSSGASPAVYRWSAVTGADGYDVYLDGTLAATVNTTRWTPTTPVLNVGLHTWQVVAHVDADFLRGFTTSFTVEGPKVAASLQSLNLPLTPNSTGTATLTVDIANVSNAPDDIVVGLFASPTGVLGHHAIPLGVATLPFSTSQQITLPVSVPPTLQPGVPYHLLLTVRIRRTTRTITFSRRTFVLGTIQSNSATGAATAAGLL